MPVMVSTVGNRRTRDPSRESKKVAKESSRGGYSICVKRSSALLLAILSTSAAPAFANGECAPTAILDGTPAVLGPATKVLLANGLRVEPAGLPPGDCPALSVRMTRAEGGYRIAISDPWGRSAERFVSDLETAGALVASWANADLVESTADLPATPVAPVIPTATTSPAVEAVEEPLPEVIVPASEENKEDVAPKEAAPAPAIDDSTAIILRLSGETGVGRDRTRWSGANLSACAPISIFCFGVSGRFNVSDDGRRAADGYLGLNLPLELGPLSVIPGVGIGGGWISEDDSRQSFRGRRGGRISIIELDDDDDGEDGLDPRIEGRVDATLHLFDRLHLQVGASISTAPTFDDDVELQGEHGTTIVRTSAGLVWGTH